MLFHNGQSKENIEWAIYADFGIRSTYYGRDK